MVIGKTDCSLAVEFCQQQSVNGFPTFKYYSAGLGDGMAGKSGEGYRGSRDLASLDRFASHRILVIYE